jgi:prolyl-tRNA synthetase
VEDVRTNILKIMDDIHNGLLEKAEKFLKDHVLETNDYEKFKKHIDDGSGMVYAKWCGDEACETKVKDDCKATSRCIPINQDGKVEELNDGKCIVCGKPAKFNVYWAKAY